MLISFELPIHHALNCQWLEAILRGLFLSTRANNFKTPSLPYYKHRKKSVLMSIQSQHNRNVCLWLIRVHTDKKSIRKAAARASLIAFVTYFIQRHFFVHAQQKSAHRTRFRFERAVVQQWKSFPITVKSNKRIKSQSEHRFGLKCKAEKKTERKIKSLRFQWIACKFVVETINAQWTCFVCGFQIESTRIVPITCQSSYNFIAFSSFIKHHSKIQVTFFFCYHWPSSAMLSQMIIL